MRRSRPKSPTPKSATTRATRAASRPVRRPARARASQPSVTTPAASQQAPLAGAMARTVADVQTVGRELGSVGASLAWGAARLAYDVGAVLGLAARGLVSATLDVADTVAPRPIVRANDVSATSPALRKPPVSVQVRPSGSARRLAS